jgi:hypothetical protein
MNVVVRLSAFARKRFGGRAVALAEAGMRTTRSPADQPPQKLRRSAEALAKAEAGHYV